jgi:hypothetical protein
MCNSQNEQILRDIVAEKVQAGQSFTAWDVTSAARSRGANEQHYQMKNVVHRMFSNGEIAGFDRTAIPTPTGTAWLYHPLGADIQPYIDAIANGQPTAGVVPSSSGATPAPASTQTATAVADDDDAADDASAFERKSATDKEGRLPIWSDMLRSIGLNPGDTAHVGTDGTVIVVDDGKGGGRANLYVVNKDGRVRIGSGILSAFLKNSTGTYSVKLNGVDRVIEITAL